MFMFRYLFSWMFFVVPKFVPAEPQLFERVFVICVFVLQKVLKTRWFGWHILTVGLQTAQFVSRNGLWALSAQSVGFRKILRGYFVRSPCTCWVWFRKITNIPKAWSALQLILISKYSFPTSQPIVISPFLLATNFQSLMTLLYPQVPRFHCGCF